MRKAISYILKRPNNDITLARTERSKPYLVATAATSSNTPAISIQSDFDKSDELYFNISHQGQYAVLAVEKQYTVGIDVMKIDEPGKFINLYEIFLSYY